MSTQPEFSSVINFAAGLAPATLDTSLTAPTNVTTLVTGGTNGTKIEEAVWQAVGTTVAGIIYFGLYNGSTYYLYDPILVEAVTSSTTAIPFRTNRQYSNLFVKNGWSSRFWVSVSGLQSMIIGFNAGGDF